MFQEKYCASPSGKKLACFGCYYKDVTCICTGKYETDHKLKQSSKEENKAVRPGIILAKVRMSYVICSGREIISLLPFLGPFSVYRVF